MNNIALLFPGQGSQYRGMSKELYNNHIEVRQLFNQANEVLRFDIKALCFEGEMSVLQRTENAQPAILISSVSAYKVFEKEYGIIPKLAAGHSLGEFSALCCANAITFMDAVRLVRSRGQYMQQAVPLGKGKMIAVSKISLKQVEHECERISNAPQMVVVANYNAPDQVVISGHTEAVNQASKRLKDLGAVIVPLNVSAPFHTPLMEPCAEKLKTELFECTYLDLKFPVISNVTATPYPNKESIPDLLLRQITSPVLWNKTMEYLRTHNIKAVLELGPRGVLKNLLKKDVLALNAFAYDDPKSREQLQMFLRGSSESTDSLPEVQEIVNRCIRAAVTTQNYNLDEQDYQNKVIEPYYKLCELKNKYNQKDAANSKSDIIISMELLKKILTFKKIEEKMMIRILNGIYQPVERIL